MKIIEYVNSNFYEFISTKIFEEEEHDYHVMTVAKKNRIQKSSKKILYIG